jgi:hypothetical protein
VSGVRSHYGSTVGYGEAFQSLDDLPRLAQRSAAWLTPLLKEAS